jgi:hypothetical protein
LWISHHRMYDVRYGGWKPFIVNYDNRGEDEEELLSDNIASFHLTYYENLATLAKAVDIAGGTGVCVRFFFG